jgi:hypothetical protein
MRAEGLGWTPRYPSRVSAFAPAIASGIDAGVVGERVHGKGTWWKGARISVRARAVARRQPRLAFADH